MSTAQSAVISVLLGLFSSTIVMADATIENRAHVKLAPGVDPSYLKRYGSARPLFSLPYDTLKELSAAEPGLPDLTLWYEVKTDPSLVRGAAKGAFHLFREVDKDFVTEFFIPVHAPPPQARRRVQSDTPDFEGNQGYLRQNVPGTNGIDAEYSWTFPGGNGEGITIYDIENSWNVDHEDFYSSIPTILNPGDDNVNHDSMNHGTAVLGVLVGSNNGLGVKGISYGAQAKVVPQMTINLGQNRADAILRAVDDGKPGDVILLELQSHVCETGEYGPAEENPDVFEAIQVAVANKIIVVEAAGNGNVNLDDPQCEGKYDGTNPDRDSGAIIVGAGGSGIDECSPARQKLYFSTYGSRVDVHGWGECVWTTGYGGEYSDPTNPTDQNKWYEGKFSGTSSASPFVAAAAANIQGIAMKQFGSPLEPKEVRKLLTETGLSQEGLDSDKHIGPLVNLRNAIDKLLGGEIMDNEIITIQAESYHNMQGVEPEATADEGGGMNVGSIDTGDWMSYPEVTIPSAGAYTIEYRVASVSGGGVLQFEKAGGTPVYGTIDIPSTGDWQNWITISHTVNLESGSQHFGIAVPVGGWNLNWFRIIMPITIQAEDYSDMLGVKTEGTTDEGGGKNVGSIDTGDWMFYPEVNIPSSGTFTVEYRVSSKSGGGVLQFERGGGAQQYGSIEVPGTGDWQAWVTISHKVNLEGGPQHFGILATVGGWNLNWFRITKSN